MRTEYNQKAEQVESFIHSSLEEASEKTEELKKEVVQYVKEHPLQSVGIAVLAGLVLGKLLK